MEEAKAPYFKPVNEAHAIVEAVLFCEFLPPLNEQTIQRLMSLEQNTELNSEFTKFEKLESKRIQLTNENNFTDFHTVESQVAGFRMQKIDASGSTGWMLHVTNSSISIHCLDYSRWEQFWEKSKKIFELVFNHLGVSDSKIASVGLKYIDQFILEGDPEEENSPSLLFLNNSNLIHKKAFTSGGRWHCHNGWFDADLNFKNLEFLNQLNIDSAYVFIQNHKKLITTIDHTISARIKESPSTDSGIPSLENNQFDQLFDFMHDSNKDTMLEILTADMAKQINLKIREKR